jgi:hypothetical protein
VALRRVPVALALLLVLGCALLRTPPALGDADPASDTLLIQNAFLPYTPPTPPTLQRALARSLTEIRATGLKLKVAVIGTPVDLGGIPELFGRPSRYARFLDTEISLHGPQPLLVVMPAGLALRDAGAPRALAGLRISSGQKSAGLVRTAVLAVQRIAQARGRPIAPVSLAKSGTDGGFTGSLVPVAAVVLLLGCGVPITRRLRRRSTVPSA